MPKRWLEQRGWSSRARWAVGCHDCKTQTSFNGKQSEGQALAWYQDHYCAEEPKDDVAYLTLPRLDMTASELRRWANPNTSVSAQWVLAHLGTG